MDFPGTSGASMVTWSRSMLIAPSSMTSPPLKRSHWSPTMRSSKFGDGRHAGQVTTRGINLAMPAERNVAFAAASEIDALHFPSSGVVTAADDELRTEAELPAETSVAAGV